MDNIESDIARLVGAYSQMDIDNKALKAENESLRAENALMREALEAVEFVSIDMADGCPWCGITAWNDMLLHHKPDCLRQRALGLADAA